MKIKANNRDRIVIRTILKFWGALCILAMVMACSKGDDGLNLINDPTINSGGNENTNTGQNTGTNDPIGVTVAIKSMEPASPATLKFGDSIAITYDYNVTRSLGARIWIQPFANGDLSPVATYSTSPVFKGTGTETVYISVSEGDTIVLDQLKTKANTAGFILLGVLTGSSTLSETLEDVDYMFTD